MTTKDTLRGWFDAGVRKQQKWMIVVCDTYDWSDYPIYAVNEEEFAAHHDRVDGKNMQKIMEVYDLRLDREMQMAVKRAFYYPEGWREKELRTNAEKTAKINQ